MTAWGRASFQLGPLTSDLSVTETETPAGLAPLCLGKLAWGLHLCSL